MLTERYGFTDDEGNIEIIIVDEILESYKIKGLNLEELQEKYVNTVDEYEEKINGYEKLLNDSEDKYNELNNSFNSLTETVDELKESLQVKNSDRNYNYSFIGILIIVAIIAFFIGKSFTSKEKS